MCRNFRQFEWQCHRNIADLFTRWQAAFAKAQPGIALRAGPPYGPPQGKLSPTLQAFIDGKSDFALVSRQLSMADTAAYQQQHGHLPLVIPLAGGSWRHFGFVDTVVVVVNRANPMRAISYARLRRIYSGKDHRLHVYGAADWLLDDTARSAVFRKHVMQGKPFAAALANSGNESDAPERVAADPLGIAVTGLGHLPADAKPLALRVPPHWMERQFSQGYHREVRGFSDIGRLNTANTKFQDSVRFNRRQNVTSTPTSAKAISPNFANVSMGLYPLSRTVDLLLHQHGPATDAFIRFVQSHEGQKIVAEQEVFLPLRQNQTVVIADCRSGLR